MSTFPSFQPSILTVLTPKAARSISFLAPIHQFVRLLHSNTTLGFPVNRRSSHVMRSLCYFEIAESLFRTCSSSFLALSIGPSSHSSGLPFRAIRASQTPYKRVLGKVGKTEAIAHRHDKGERKAQYCRPSTSPALRGSSEIRHCTM